MRSTPFRMALAAVAAGALVASVLTSQFRYLSLALLALLLLATGFSQAGRLTEPLQGFRHHPVDVRVWGSPLPVPKGATTSITSVKALGAGLHLYCQVGITGSPLHLKVAQPRGVLLAPQNVCIESAAYVQLSGKKLPRVSGAPALTIALSPGPSEVHRVALHQEG